MAKKIIFCDECHGECIISYKGKEEPKVCPFCGTEIDTEWNTDDGEEPT